MKPLNTKPRNRNKLIALCITVFISATINVNAQTWIDEGATWHYEWNETFAGGVIKIEYQKDTVINGLSCEKLVGTEYSLVLTGSNTMGIDTSSYDVGYTYSNGDTVFYYVNGDFHILYNFGAQPGDTWDLGVDTNNLMCSTSIVQVDSIGTININSQSYRWISVHPQPGSSVGLSGKIIERFGSVQGYLFPTGMMCDTLDSSIIVDGIRSYSFNCFQDNSFSLYNVSANDCDYIFLDVGMEKHRPSFNVYPNPFSDQLTLEFDKHSNYQIKVFDLIGKELMMMNVVGSSHVLSTSHLPAGVYVIQVRSEDRTGTQKLIKK